MNELSCLPVWFLAVQNIRISETPTLLMCIPFAYSNNFTHSLLYFLCIALYSRTGDSKKWFALYFCLVVKILYVLYPNKVLFLPAFCCALCFVRKISLKLSTNSQIPPDIFLDSQFSTSNNLRQ